MWDQVGSAAVIKVRTWALGVDNGTQGVYEPGAGDTLVLGADNVLDPSLWEAEYSADKFKGEGTLNLTDTIFKTATADCLTIGNVIPGTVTGNSDTADYKDVVLADIAEKVTISSCGAVQVRKVTVPSGGTGGFSYTLSRTDGTALDYFQPTNRTTRTAGLTGDGYTAPAETDLRAGTNYTLSETIAAGTPYTLTSISCSLDGQAYAITSATSTFPVKAGKTTQCTVTNTAQQVSLTLVKTVTNDNGGTALATAWDLTALRKGTTTKVIDAAETGTPGASVTTGAGTFAPSESGGPSGDAAGTWSCVEARRVEAR